MVPRKWTPSTIPALPMRSPAEGMIAQAIAGLPGVSLGQYGSFAIDPGLVRTAMTETVMASLAGNLKAWVALVVRNGERARQNFLP